MADELPKVTFRLRRDVQTALAKIVAVKAADYGSSFNQTDAFNVAILAYAKTLPDPPTLEAPPKDKAPEKI